MSFSSRMFWNSLCGIHITSFLNVLYNLLAEPVFFVGRHLTYKLNFYNRYRTIQVIYLSEFWLFVSFKEFVNLIYCRIYKHRDVHSIFNPLKFLGVYRDTPLLFPTLVKIEFSLFLSVLIKIGQLEWCFQSECILNSNPQIFWY